MRKHLMAFRAAMLCCLCAGTGDTFGGTSGVKEDLVVNGGFERGLEGWTGFWTREAGAGRSILDLDERHGGRQALRIEHRGAEDWSLGPSAWHDVAEGEIFELSAWVRLEGPGRAELGVVTRDPMGEVVAWNHAEQSTGETDAWRPLRARFVIPRGVASIQSRFTGRGPGTAWLDDMTLVRAGHLDALRNKEVPRRLALRGETLSVVFDTEDATITVEDPRSERRWVQHVGQNRLVVQDANVADGEGIRLDLLDPRTMIRLAATVQVTEGHPECVVRIKAEGELTEPLRWPPPFASARGEFLVLPVNEGISYPVDDPSIPPMHYYLYGGHGLCMAWYGSTDGEAGWMALVETPDDAAVDVQRKNGLLGLAPEWQPQKGRFGGERTLRYVFFDAGGYVAMAKRYREHAKATGNFMTLEEKREAIPAVDLLVGAVNIWCWDQDAPALCRDLQEAGIERILWSHRVPPDEIRALNDLGVLTSRYDIYQDAMDPSRYPELNGIHQDWTSEAWANDDLLIGRDGRWVRGWEVKAKDGEMIPCGVLCDRQAVAYARRRIPEELATHPYRCRFIDTTTASPWRACYHPKHPMTRTDSRRSKMDLLAYISDGCGLVCGSETGHDAAVRYVHFFEGMLSLGPYRIPDAGRDMQRIWDEVPERVARFQTGHAYRLPLWELVYHDCVVAHWYWGDYNNKFPKLWDRRDAWNALYGTPPMFMFDKQAWETNRDRFVTSYQAATPVARATGYTEMLSHEWLTPDHAVQRTRFANGVTVSVNFGDRPYPLPDGVILPPTGQQVEGLVPDK